MALVWKCYCYGSAEWLPDGLAQDMAGMDSGHRQLVSVALNGKTSGTVLANLGGIIIVISQDRSIWRWPHSYVSPQSPCRV